MNNIIICKDKKTGYFCKIIESFDTTNIFSPDYMNIYLDQFKYEENDKPCKYDDIISMYIVSYMASKSIIFPSNLEKLEIKYTNFKCLPKFPVSIKSIILHDTEIGGLDYDMSYMKNLTQLKILSSNIPETSVNIFPPNLIIKQINYMTNPRRHYTTPLDTIYDLFNNEYTKQKNKEDDKTNAKRYINEIANSKNVIDINSTQTVHLPSINVSANNSIKLIIEEANKYEKLENPIETLFQKPNQETPKDKKTKTPIFDKMIHPFVKIYNYLFEKSCYNNQIGRIRVQIEISMKDTSIHSISKLTYAELFEYVVRIAKHHTKPEDAYERIMIETLDSIGMCFTGRMNRLVNSMVGIVDGLHVGISPREQLQMEIQIIMNDLIHKKGCVKDTKQKMKQLFETVDDTVMLPMEKKSYMDALDDYDDEPVFTYGNDFVESLFT